MNQVISINKDGSVAGLQHKKGTGIDLRAFGKASICRASEVLWCDENQKWYVEFQKGANAALEGVKLSQFMLEQSGYPKYVYQCADGSEPYYFNEYEDAVDGEIFYLNQVRLARVEK